MWSCEKIFTSSIYVNKTKKRRESIWELFSFLFVCNLYKSFIHFQVFSYFHNALIAKRSSKCCDHFIMLSSILLKPLKITSCQYTFKINPDLVWFCDINNSKNMRMVLIHFMCFFFFLTIMHPLWGEAIPWIF